MARVSRVSALELSSWVLFHWDLKSFSFAFPHKKTFPLCAVCWGHKFGQSIAGYRPFISLFFWSWSSMQVGVKKRSTLGFRLLVMLNDEANSSESWPEHHKWSTTSLVIYSAVLLLLTGRETSISGCMWVSKEEWGDLRVISYLERVALPQSYILDGRARGWGMWEEGKDRRAFRKEMDWSLVLEAGKMRVAVLDKAALQGVEVCGVLEQQDAVFEHST